MRKRLVVGSSLLVCGCVSVQNTPMDAASLEQLRGRSVTLSQREKPDFGAMTPGTAMFGVAGATATISQGNEIVRTHGIEDPASSIAAVLGRDLQARYDMEASSRPVQVASDDLAQVARASSRVDLLLDVRTLSWGFAYIPTTWNRYRVRYSARLRLFDMKTARVLAEGGCRRLPDETPDAPSYEELLANGAQRLKAELRRAAEHCLGEFRAKTLSLGEGSGALFALESPADAQAQPQSTPAPAKAAEDKRAGRHHKGRRGNPPE